MMETNDRTYLELLIRNGSPEIAYRDPILTEMAKQRYVDESENVTESDVEIKDVVIGEHNAN